MDNIPIPTKDEFSLFSTIFNYILNGLIGLIVAVWYVSEQKNKFQNQMKEVVDTLKVKDEKIKTLEEIIFKDKEGLNVLTIDAHTKTCLLNQEIFGKDYESILKEITHIKEDVSELNEKVKNSDYDSHFVAIRESLKNINQKIKVAYSHDRRKILQDLAQDIED